MLEIAHGVTFDFDGRRAVVTGGASGIGLAVARMLLDAGASVTIADANRAEVERQVDSLSAYADRLLVRTVDVADEEDVRGLMAESNDRFGGIDILVNCAGITSTKIVEETSFEEWRRVIDVNLNGIFLTCREAMRYFLPNRYGRIVNVSSVASKRLSYNASAAYTASKYGLLGLTKHLAYEVAPVGVRVNAVCPGPVMTEMLQSMSDAEVIEARRATVPSGRISTPEDQARIILMYASDLVDMIAGTALDVDGGALLGWYPVETYFDRRKASRSWDGV
ncbi:SDR family NAD(P)-dependent oxidoreductase [Gulosibacter sp. 10]|uniref:SDR family NAD(P)-dependent oxidoreductase n=1 Tax=Gulosibacter sp. 10 TaxID=1255570 RepID=UPI00097EB782|nr:SDR family NAD(P)-dependent oxidoreductase [Gulosibacter sp. 10]SJM51176.1 Dehydrogenases with different specificities (related to short-chain alcohol dehydrogenases) [Gulosibacter sp. 10]